MEVIHRGLAFPEGPAFDLQGRLWCVEIEGGCITCLSEDPVIRIPTEGRPNGLAFAKDGLLWVCDQTKGLLRVNIQTKEVVVIANTVNGVLLDRPNDLAFDSAGNLVFTCPANSRETPTGKVWVRRHDGEIHCLADDHYFPNGLVFLDNSQTLVVAETYKHRLLKGRWDARTCVWSDVHPWVDVGGPIGPDGLAVGPGGHIFAAIYNAQAIRVVSPDGRIVDTIQTPTKCPTNLVFSPSEPRTFYFTEAEMGQCYRAHWHLP
jgi:gluconolactonase